MGNVAVEGLGVLLALFVAAATLITFAGGNATAIAGPFAALFTIGVFVALFIGAFSAAS